MTDLSTVCPPPTPWTAELTYQLPAFFFLFTLLLFYYNNCHIFDKNHVVLHLQCLFENSVSINSTFLTLNDNDKLTSILSSVSIARFSAKSAMTF